MRFLVEVFFFLVLPSSIFYRVVEKMRIDFAFILFVDERTIVIR